MYIDRGNVYLVRAGKEFSWELNLNGVKASFGNQNHFIKKMEVRTHYGPLEIVFGDFMQFGGLHFLPK